MTDTPPVKIYEKSELDPSWTNTQRIAFAELIRKDYSTFVRYFWPTVEPKALVWGWHIQLIADHLQALHQGTLGTNKLAIAVPPGAMKSSLTSVFYDAWKWLSDPGQRCLVASHDLPLVIRDNVKCRRVVESDAYKQILGLLAALGREPWGMAKDQNQKSYFENSKKGFRQCTTVGSGGTGKRGDATVVDDPHKIVDIIHASPARQIEILQETCSWFTDVFSSRLNDMSTDKQVVIMQRIHEEDLFGQLAKDKSWHLLVLPMCYDPEVADEDDPRTTPGELLFPAKFPQAVVDAQQAKMSAGQWSAQYQQKPIPTKGGLVHADWCQRRYQWTANWRENPVLPKIRRLVVTFDCANKARKLNDPTVGMLLGEDSQGDIYLLDLKLERYEYADLEIHAPMWLDGWRAHTVLIEDAANGTALLSKLGRLGYKPIGILPHQDKHVRMSNETPWFRSGRMVLPSDDCPFMAAFLFELLKFPQVRHDDQVDALSQGLAYFTNTPIRNRSAYAFSSATEGPSYTQDAEGRVVRIADPGGREAAPPRRDPDEGGPPSGPSIDHRALADAQLADLRRQVAGLMRR